MKKRIVILIIVSCFFPRLAKGDALEQIRERGAIRWGGDQEGGGPYIYPDPDNPHKMRGFEVEMMDLVAAKLGTRSEFCQCEWTNLPDMLRTGGIDVIVNGFELTAARLQTNIATIPYYIYELRLIGRKGDSSIQDWDDLGRAGGRQRKVGILTGSGAETYIRQRFGKALEIRNYPGFTDAMLDVVNQNLDATVQDNPPAIFYRNRFPSLHLIGQPAGLGYYVMYLRPQESALRKELNTILGELIQTGRLRALYERYGLWSALEERLGSPDLEANVTEQATEFHGREVIRRDLPILMESAWVTVALSCSAMPLAIMAGLLIALGRLYGPKPLRWALAGYVEVLRGTPLLFQLYTIYYVVAPAMSINLGPFPAAVLGLALNYSAYESEIYRAGILTIPAGQLEAALCLGMTRAVALRRIIVPQAVRLVIPPVTNDFIALFKDTSICSVITVVELSKRYSILVNSTNAYIELMAMTAVLYLLMSYPLSLAARWLEVRRGNRS